MRISRAVLVIGCLLPGLTSCTGTSSAPAGTGPAYTCCAATDIDMTYQPGQTLTVHWIVVPGKPGPASTVVQVELTARLVGPYPTVADLKAADGSDPGDARTFAAEPVRPSGLAGEQPVSDLLIPTDAAPGYYNLITSVTEPGSMVSGGSVIQVVPRTSTTA